jgi:hypothetical protein
MSPFRPPNEEMRIPSIGHDPAPLQGHRTSNVLTQQIVQRVILTILKTEVG